MAVQIIIFFKLQLQNLEYLPHFVFQFGGNFFMAKHVEKYKGYDSEKKLLKITNFSKKGI